MAQSIYVTLATRTTETSVPQVKSDRGVVLREAFGSPEMVIPDSMLPTDKEFEDATLLEAWAKENGVFHQCLQSGVSSRLIDLRAIFKAMPSKADYEKGVRWDVAYGQDRLNEADWKVQERPDGKGSKNVANIRTQDAIKMALNLKTEQGLPDVAILGVLTATYDAELATLTMDTIAKYVADAE